MNAENTPTEPTYPPIEGIDDYLAAALQRARNANDSINPQAMVAALEKEDKQAYQQSLREAARALEMAEQEVANKTLDEQAAIAEAKKTIEEQQAQSIALREKQEVFNAQKEQLVLAGLMDENEQINFSKLASMIVVPNHFAPAGETLVSVNPSEKSLHGPMITLDSLIAQLDEKLGQTFDLASAPVQLKALKPEENDIIATFNDYKNSGVTSEALAKESAAIATTITNAERLVAQNEQKIEAIREETLKPHQNRVADAQAVFEDSTSRIASAEGNGHLTSVLKSFDQQIARTHRSDASAMKNELREELAKVYAGVVEAGGDANMLLDDLRSNDKLKHLAPPKLEEKHLGLADNQHLDHSIRLHFHEKNGQLMADVISNSSDITTEGPVGQNVTRTLVIKNGSIDLSEFSHLRIELSGTKQLEGQNIQIFGLSDSNPAKFIGAGFDSRGYTQHRGANADPSLVFDVVGSNSNDQRLNEAGILAKQHRNYVSERENSLELAEAMKQKEKAEKLATVNKDMRQKLGSTEGKSYESNQKIESERGGMADRAVQAALSGINNGQIKPLSQSAADASLAAASGQLGGFSSPTMSDGVREITPTRGA